MLDLKSEAAKSEAQAGADYTFGPFLLETNERRLTNNGRPVPLTPKEFDLLLLLVSNHGRLLTKAEILDRVWEGCSSYESSLTAHISTLREALAHTREKRYIETVSKRGYRFVANVEQVRSNPSAGPLPAALPPSSAPRFRILCLGALVVACCVLAAVVLLGWARPGPTSLYQRALEFERQGNDRLAIEALNRALSLNPHFDDANLRAARLYWADNDTDHAWQHLQAIGGDPDQASGHQRATLLEAEALRLVLADNTHEALIKLELAAEADPGDADVMYDLGDLQVGLGLLREADQSALQCSTADIKNPYCSYLKVQLRVYQNRFNDALAEYEQAKRRGASNVWLDEQAGFAKLGLGDPDGATKLFQRVQEQGKSWGSLVHFRAAQYRLAMVRMYEGRFRDARQQMIAALQTAESNHARSSYYVRLATLDALNGRWGDSAEEVRNATRISNFSDLAIQSTRVLAMSRQYESAWDILRAQSRNSASFGPSYPAADQFVRGLQAIANRDYGAAIAALQNSNHFDPRPDTAWYLAQAEMAAALWDPAAAALRDLLNAKGKILMEETASLVPLAERDLAICYEHLGDPARASSLLSEARTQWRQGDSDMRQLLSGAANADDKGAPSRGAARPGGS